MSPAVIAALSAALTTNAQDVPYLSPLIEEIEAEMREREDLESMVLKKKSNKS